MAVKPVYKKHSKTKASPKNFGGSDGGGDYNNKDFLVSIDFKEVEEKLDFNENYTLLREAAKIRNILRIIKNLKKDKKRKTKKEEVYERRLIEIRNKIILANRGLVASMALKIFHGRKIHFCLEDTDLINEGILGLIKAIDRFDFKRGNKFSTYAVWWIRGCIEKAILEAYLIRIPKDTRKSYIQILNFRSNFFAEFGRMPSDEEIAEFFSMQIDILRSRRTLPVPNAISLEQPIRHDDKGGRNEKIKIKDVLPDCFNIPEDVFFVFENESRIKQTVEEILNPVSKIGRTIIEMRFSIDDGDDEEKTYKEIGEKVGLTRQRVEQIFSVNLKKLQKSPRVKRLNPFED